MLVIAALFLVVLGASVLGLRTAGGGPVSGSQSSETVTLWVVLIVGPVLLATCLALLIVGAVLRTR